MVFGVFSSYNPQDLYRSIPLRSVRVRCSDPITSHLKGKGDDVDMSTGSRPIPRYTHTEPHAHTVWATECRSAPRHPPLAPGRGGESPRSHDTCATKPRSAFNTRCLRK